VGKAKFPLVGDPTHTLTNMFGVHIAEEGLALRGTFIINPDGQIKTAEVHSNEIARDVSETCASSRPPSTPPPTPARCARPSGTKAPRR
jgi:alkyl hydroperoxide reductase subunit AhpC